MSTGTGESKCESANVTGIEQIVTWRTWVVLSTILILVLTLVRRWLRSEFAVILAVMLLYSAEILTTEESLLGFSDEGVLSICMTNILTEGLISTGGVDYILAKSLGKTQTLRMVLLTSVVLTAVSSSFLNGSRVILLMMPRVLNLCSSSTLAWPSIMLLPLANAASLGGLLMQIGSSASMLLASQTRGYCLRIGYFGFSLTTVPFVIILLSFLIVFGPFLLPSAEISRQRAIFRRPQSGARFIWLKRVTGIVKRVSGCLGLVGTGTEPEDGHLVEMEDLAGEDPTSAGHTGHIHRQLKSKDATKSSGKIHDFLMNALIMSGSNVVGQTVMEAGLRGEAGLYLVSVQRGNTLYSAVGRGFELLEGDMLSFTGIPDGFVPFCQRKGLSPVLVDAETPEPLMANVIEAVVRDGSMLIGRTPKEVDFRRRYNAAILSIKRAGHRLPPQRMGLVLLRIGDELLCATSENFDWRDKETLRDLKPRVHPEQERLMQVQDLLAEHTRPSHALNESIPSSTSAFERVFYTSMKVMGPSRLGSSLGSSLSGKTVEDAGLRSIPGVILFAIQRSDPAIGILMTIRTIGHDFILEVDDILWFSGEREGITALRRIPGLIDGDARQLDKLEIAAHQRRLVEVVISLRSELLYKTVRESGFRRRFSAAIVAIHRRGAPVATVIGDVVLEPGDVLLLDAGPGFISNFRDDSNFLLAVELAESSPPRTDKVYVAVLTLLGLIISATVWQNTIDILLPLIWACVVLLTAQCLTPERAMKSVDFANYLVMGAGIALSRAISKTGLAYMIAHGIGTSSAVGNALMLSLIVTGVSSLISQDLAILFMFPIAMQMADLHDVGDRDLSSMRQMFSTSMLLGTALNLRPFGNMINFMVFGPGGYQVLDYIKLGVPMLAASLITQFVLFWRFEYLAITWTIAFGIGLGTCIYTIHRERLNTSY